MSLRVLPEHDSDNIYYNFALTNNTINQQLPCNFSVNLTDTIVENPSDYYMSVLRATIPLNTVPIFTFPDGTVNNPNDFWVCLNVGGTDYQTQLVFTQNQRLGAAITNGVYSYRHMIEMINTALLASYTAIPSKPTGVSEAPFMTYDSSSGLFSLWCQQSYIGQVEIWYSSALYLLFDNFHIFWNGYPPTVPIYKGVRFYITNYNNNIVNTTEHPNYLQFVQEFNSKFNWNDLRQIVFKSFNIPINYEYAPQPGLNPQNATSQSGAIIISPELTDIEPTPDPESNFRDTVYYQPGPQYRLVDMTSTQPLRKLDLQIFWRDNKLNEHSILIGPGYTATVKIGFLKKSMFNNAKKIY
jgi:hypothetical protein